MSKVKKYATALSEGRWKLNGETLIIADTGKLLDGQHRCHAIVTSGVSMLAIVIYGIPEETFVTMDTGCNRTGEDVIGIEGCVVEGVKNPAADYWGPCGNGLVVTIFAD